MCSVFKGLALSFFLGFLSFNGYSQRFTDKQVPLPKFREPAFVLFDVDNDGDLDFLFSGGVSDPYSRSDNRLFVNQGGWKFQENSLEENPKLIGDGLAWDQDCNGSVDLMLDGSILPNAGSYTGIYLNYGNNELQYVDGHTGPLRNNAWIDVDNDGFKDLCYGVGSYDGKVRMKRYYRGDYFEFDQFFFCNHYFNPKFVDIDNDGDQDLISANEDGYPVLRKNNGKGVYGSASVVGAFEKKFKDLYPVDLNSDGWMDFVMIPEAVDNVYFGVNNGVSIQVVRTDFKCSSNQTSFHAFDPDNDGLLDLFITYNEHGMDGEHVQYLKNSGDMNFVQTSFYSSQKFERVWSADIDGDGDQDLALTNGFWSEIAFFMNNNWVEDGNMANTPPTKPANISVTTGDQIHVTWDQSSDKETPDSAISYDIQFFRNGELFSAGAADPQTAFNRIPHAPSLNRGEEVVLNAQDWPGGSYSCKIAAKDLQESFSDFGEALFTIPQSPHIEDITISANYFPQIHYTLPDSYMAESIIVERKNKRDIYFQKIDTVKLDDRNIYLDKTVEINKDYVYRLRCLTAGISSGVSNEFNCNASPFNPKVIAKGSQYFAWIDYNGDKFPDLVYSVYENGNCYLQLDVNNQGTFEKKFKIPCDSHTSLRKADLNGDLRPEIVMAGMKLNIYEVGEESFRKVELDEEIEGFLVSCSEDLDANGYADILLAGKYSRNYILKNKGNFVFEKIEFHGFDGSGFNSPVVEAVIDADKDGMVDIIASDKVYINQENLAFSAKEKNDYNLDIENKVDIDGDHVYDELKAVTDSFHITLSHDQREFSYSKINNGVTYHEWIDYNGDGYVDLVFGYYKDGHSWLAVLEGAKVEGVKKIKPSDPEDLQCNLSNKIQLEWKSSQDVQSESTHLKYQIYLYSVDSEKYLIHTGENPSAAYPWNSYSNCGYRGNCIKLTDLPPGKYQWGVQAVGMNGMVSEYIDGPEFDVLPSIDLDVEALNFENVKIQWPDIGWADSVAIEYSIIKSGKSIDNCRYDNVIFRKVSPESYKHEKLPRECHIVYRQRAFSQNSISNYSETVSIRVSDFIRDQSTQLPQLTDGFVKWADLDGDDDYDLFLMGYDDNKNGVVKVFENRDNCLFEKSVPFQFLDRFIVDIIDINNDNNLDVIIAGTKEYIMCYDVYVNNGQWNFTKANTWFPPDMNDHEYKSHSYSDINGDGLKDLITKNALYENTGYYFVKKFDIPIDYVDEVSCYDLDRDGNKDIILSNRYDNSLKYYIYTDDGLEFNNEIGYVALSRSVMGDYNSDGWMDFMPVNTGLYDDNIFFSNDEGLFSKVEVMMNKNYSGSGVTADYDNDGYLDLIVSGQRNRYNNSSYGLTYNSNLSNLEPLILSSIEGGGRNCQFDMADFDKDGDLDMVLCGKIYNTQKGVTKILKSNIVAVGDEDPNKSPSIPQNVRIQEEEGAVKFTWDASHDDKTAQEALTYNVVIKDDQGNYMVSPQSNEETGFLMLTKHGNVGSTKSFKWQYKKNGNYQFAVQAIDNAFNASAFSEFLPFELFLITDVEKVDQSIDVTLSAGILRVVVPHSMDGCSMQIMDVAGRVYNDVKIRNSSSQIHTSGWPQGIYLIKLTFKNNSLVKKIFIK